MVSITGITRQTIVIDDDDDDDGGGGSGGGDGMPASKMSYQLP
jgi:hypothetical protein